MSLGASLTYERLNQHHVGLRLVQGEKVLFLTVAHKAQENWTFTVIFLTCPTCKQLVFQGFGESRCATDSYPPLPSLPSSESNVCSGPVEVGFLESALLWAQFEPLACPLLAEELVEEVSLRRWNLEPGGAIIV